MNRLALLAASLLLAASVATIPRAEARPMTPEDVARLEQVGEIAVSPDGKRVAYTRLRMPDVTRGERNGRTMAQLKLAWGAEQGRPFLPANMDVTQIRFSPDGKFVGFIWAEPNGKDAVWAIPVDGGAHAMIGEVADANVQAYAWAPDGGRLYMLAGPALDALRKAEKDAGFDAVIYEEDHEYNRLFVARIGDKPDTAPRQIAVPGHVSALALTRDGRHAVLQTAPTPLIDDSFTSKRVNLLDLQTGAIRVIATPGKIGDVEMAPDGRTLALVAAVDQHDPAATTLYFVDAVTGALTPINKDAPEAVMDTVWLDDERLAAVVHTGAVSRYRIYGRDGAVLSDVPTGPAVLTAIDAQGGLVAARAEAATHPAELFVHDGSDFRRWTRHNPWLADITMGAQRLFHYTARDGQRIEGILIEPAGGVKKGGAPTVLDVHGGPEAHEVNGWHTNYSGPGQVAAGRGYAVFLPNYRGSTAYGTAFSKQHQADYAGKEFDDLVDAKQALVDAGITDPARVGMTGGSYGGYATGWAATAQSEHFAAGVMFVGIANQVSKFGTTEIPQEMYLVHERKWPWEEWDRLLERSPIYHAGKARTPLLILHGIDDTRVDKGQSFELYRHIKIRTDTPVRLVLYPGEGHGNRRAAARYDYNLRMMEWFDRYLLGAAQKTGGTMPPSRPVLPDSALPK